MNLIKKSVIAAAACGLFGAAISTPANANTFLGTNGQWYGNICQTSLGWQVMDGYYLVGSGCYSPGWNAYGYVANA